MVEFKRRHDKFLNHITRFENDSLVTEILKYTSYFLIPDHDDKNKNIICEFHDINTDVEARDTAIIDEEEKLHPEQVILIQELRNLN